MQELTCSCDVCGAEKGETSQWLLVTGEPDGFVAEPWPQTGLIGDFSEYEHICGQECLHKRLNQWLEGVRTNGGSNGSNSSEG